MRPPQVSRHTTPRSRIESRRHPLGSSPGTALAQPPGATSVDDNGVVVALGTAEDDELARLRAGEATSLVLLTATALGLASRPFTEPPEIAENRDAV